MELALVLLAVLAVFVPALMLPGPDFVAVVRATLTRGVRGGLLATFGVTLGLTLYASLSLLGLSALLAEAQWLAMAVRLAGGAYLVYLGVRLLRTRRADFAVTAEQPSATRSVVFGFTVTLTNPKAVVLFASVFAPAVGPATPDWFLALLVAIVAASALTWYAIVTLVITTPAVMARLTDAKHLVERAAGATFVALGLTLMARSRVAPAP